MPVGQTIKKGVYIISKSEIFKQIFIPPSIRKRFPILSVTWLIVTIIVTASQTIKKYQSGIAQAFIIISLAFYVCCVCYNIYRTFKEFSTIKREKVVLEESLAHETKSEKGFNITYSEGELSIKYNGESKNDEALKKVILGAFEEYQASNEQQKEQWRKEWEDYMLNHKW